MNGSVDWEALQRQVVASIRADLLIGACTPGFTTGEYFVNGVKDSVRDGIQAYLDKQASRMAPISQEEA